MNNTSTRRLLYEPCGENHTFTVQVRQEGEEEEEEEEEEERAFKYTLSDRVK